MRVSLDNEYQPSHQRYSISGGLAFGDSSRVGSMSRLSEAHKAEALKAAMTSLKAKMDAFVPSGTSMKAVMLTSKIRDDVRINPPDETGWRSPSDYHAVWYEDTSVEYHQGPYAFFNAKYTVEYFGEYFYRCRLEGNAGVTDYRLPLSIPLHSGPSSNTENRLLASALSQLRNQKFDLALAMLEGKETIATLGGLIEKLRALLLAIRNKDLSHLHKAFGFKTKNRNAKGVYTKDSSSLWLEANYGVAPIIYDVYGLCEFFEQELRKAGFRIVARSKTEYRETETINPTPTSPYQRFSAGTVNVYHDVTQKVALWYELDAANLHLAESLGLTNPLLWIWEKTTLSFVVDWLLPIGDVLAGLSSDIGFKYHGGSHTYFSRSFGYGDVSPISITDAWKYQTLINIDPYRPLRTSSPHGFNGQMSRRVYTTSPKPGIFIKDPFSVSHIVTSVALLGSAFAKTHR